MFCSTDLAARIERAERRLVASAVARVRQRVPDTFTADIAGGFVACTEPGSPLNKAVGLGFAPFDAAAWAAVEAEHTRREAPLQVELSTLADPALAHELAGRGFRLVNFENVSGRPLAPGERPAMPPGLVVDVCPAHAIERWLDVIVTGFCTPDTQGVASHEAYDRALIAGIVRDFANADGVTLFLATRAGDLAGAASMRLDDGVAQLCGAATLPAHRRHGVQTALLAHRLGRAAAAGCDLAVATTQPGSKSQQNMQRAGFHLLYGRSILVRPPA
ncbi:MAG: GNAT family N-acetyltransferase [Planctomycetes bacterium]|nr:GNAT family N-acetyltransferase [Planctomycetota bacterium]